MAKKEKLEKKKAGPIDKRAWGVWGSRSADKPQGVVGAKEAKATMKPKKCKGVLVWDDKTGKCVIPENLRKVIAKERLKPVTKVLKNKKK